MVLDCLLYYFLNTPRACFSFGLTVILGSFGVTVILVALRGLAGALQALRQAGGEEVCPLPRVSQLHEVRWLQTQQDRARCART